MSIIEVLTYIFVLVVGLWIVNRYIFSWLGLLLNLIGVIHYKSVTVVEDSVVGKQLSFLLNLRSVAAICQKPPYKIIDHGHGVLVMRNWGDVQYRLWFTNYPKFSGSVKSTGFFRASTQHKVSIDHGERPFYPTKLLKRRIFQMINDMPLSAAQKREIRKSIRIRWCSSISLGWI